MKSLLRGLCVALRVMPWLVFAGPGTVTKAQSVDTLDQVAEIALQARYSINEIFRFSGKLPDFGSVHFPSQRTDLVDVISWNGDHIWIVYNAARLGEELVLNLTPSITPDQVLSWACSGLGGFRAFRENCGADLDHRDDIKQAAFRSGAPAADINGIDPYEIINRLTRLPRTLINEYLVNNGSLPAREAIPATTISHPLLSQMRWSGEYLWMHFRESGQELLLRMEPVNNKGFVEWACQRMNANPRVPENCSDWLNPVMWPAPVTVNRR